jgi:hypothetical protein
MTDSKADPKKPRPFSDKPETVAAMPSVDVGAFAPKKQDDDVVPQTGTDLSDRPKLIFVIGRGKTGKTTFLRWVAEEALDRNRPFLMADIDPTNASFSSYFPDVSRPSGHDPVEVRSWVQRFIGYAVENKITALITWAAATPRCAPSCRKCRPYWRMLRLPVWRWSLIICAARSRTIWPRWLPWPVTDLRPRPAR